MPTNNNYTYGPAPVDTGATTVGPVGPLDRAPDPVPPGPGLGTVPVASSEPVTPPQVELPVDLTANTTVSEAPNVSGGAQQRYITILANGVVVTNNATTLNFSGNGVTVSSLGTAGANILITAGNGSGSNYSNSNVSSFLAAFGSNTISTTGNITGGNIKGNIQAADGNGAVQFNVNGILGAAAGFNYQSNTGALFSKSINGTGDPVSGTGAIYGGLGSFTQLGSTVLGQFTGNVNSYAQLNLQNINHGDLSSADYIITADNGTDTTHYLDLGLAGSNHADPNFFGDTTTANDGYLYVAGNSQAGPSNGAGNLILGSTNGNIKLFVGNTAQANVVATLASNTINLGFGNNSWTFDNTGTLTFPDNSGSSWPIASQRFGMGNIGAWLDGQWTIGEFSGNGVSGQVGIRIDPGIEGNTGITLPSQADSVTQPVSIYNTGGGGISLYTGANNWTFGSDGNLTLPNNSNFAIVGNITQFNTCANGFLGLNSYDAGGNNIARVGIDSIDGLVGIGTYDPATDTDYSWNFKNNGSTIFPTLDTPYGDQPTGNNTGPTLRIGDGINDGIISSPDGTVDNSYNNIVLQPGQGYDDSRGGKTIIHGGRGGPTAGSGGGDVRIFGGYGTGGGSGGDIELYPGNSANADNAGSVRIVGTNYSQLWQFNNSGNVIFPTLTVDLHNGGNQSGQTLQFGDPNQQAFITGPAPAANIAAQRLIIQGQRGNGTGEGGDVYVWGGDSNVNGGDIKIYAGDADTAGIGGNIHIAGGRGTTDAGEITLTGGRNDGGTGASVALTGGLGLTGGAVSLTGGYGADGDGGAINIGGGTAAGGLSYYGNVNITAGASSWAFRNDGNLTVPGNIVHGNARLSLHENNSNTAYLTSTTDDTTALYMDTASAQLYSSSILVTGTGNNGVYIGTSNTRIVQDSADSSQVGNIELRTSLNNQNYAWVFDSTGNLTTPGSGGDITGANVVGAVTLSATGVVKTGVFVTGNIPSAVTAGAGARAFVSDANINTWGNLYVGGAGNAVPVWSNGTNWYIG